VKATAGMRIVEPSMLRRVFDAVDAYLLNPELNPFKFVASEVLGGEEEAVFAYLSINHMLGRVTPACPNCLGVLDMGGASMQIAYKPKGDILANEFSYYVLQQRQSVYAKSYIRFGLEEAILRLKKMLVREGQAGTALVDFPCFACDYSEVTDIDGHAVNFTGTGDSLECQRLTRMLLHVDYECLLEPCPMMGVHMSPLEGLPFYAISGFFYVAAGLGLVAWNDMKVVSPAQIEAATQALCGRTQLEALAHSGAPWRYLKGFCFAGHYVRHILGALGFGDDSTAVTFLRQMPGGARADWTQGAALFETQYMPMSLSAGRGPCRASTDDEEVHLEESPSSGLAAGKWQASSPVSLAHAESVGSSAGGHEGPGRMAGWTASAVVVAGVMAVSIHFVRSWPCRPHWQAVPLLPEGLAGICIRSAPDDANEVLPSPLSSVRFASLRSGAPLVEGKRSLARHSEDCSRADSVVHPAADHHSDPRASQRGRD